MANATVHRGGATCGVWRVSGRGHILERHARRKLLAVWRDPSRDSMAHPGCSIAPDERPIGGSGFQVHQANERTVCAHHWVTASDSGKSLGGSWRYAFVTDGGRVHRVEKIESNPQFVLLANGNEHDAIYSLLCTIVRGNDWNEIAVAETKLVAILSSSGLVAESR